MEDLHRTHKEVPFGYWTELVVPAYRAIVRRLRGRKTTTLPAEIRLIGMR